MVNILEHWPFGDDGRVNLHGPSIWLASLQSQSKVQSGLRHSRLVMPGGYKAGDTLSFINYHLGVFPIRSHDEEDLSIS